MILFAITTTQILFISSAGVMQAMLLAGLLYFHPKSDRSVTSFLSLHILTLSIFMLLPVAQYFFSWFSLVLLFPFQFLIGPFLYLYVRSFKETITRRKEWLHFLLFAVLLIINFVMFLSLIKKYPASVQPPGEMLSGVDYYIRILVRDLQLLLYYFLARRALFYYQKSIQYLYSETSKINLAWVRWLLNGYLLLVITVTLRSFLVVIYPEKYNLMILINTAIITPYIYLVAFKGISQPTLWQIQSDINKETVQEEIQEAEKMEIKIVTQEKPKVTETGSSIGKHAEIVKKIFVLMEEQKLYQETELTLQQLSDKLQLPTYQVSQVINEGMKKNFYDLVNGYRVEEAKRLLVDPKNENYTILFVGFESGFNSKTTFNTVFKKFTGFTPTEFRGKHRIEMTAL